MTSYATTPYKDLKFQTGLLYSWYKFMRTVACKLALSFFILLIVSCTEPASENNCLLLSQEFIKPCLADDSRLYRRHEKKAVDYFMEIGFGTEYFDFGPSIVKKWASSIHIKLHGDYKQSDIKEIKKITDELSQLTGLVFIIDSPTPNMNIYFTLRDELSFSQKLVSFFLPEPLPIGYFYGNDNEGLMYEAVILVNKKTRGALQIVLIKRGDNPTLRLNERFLCLS